MSLDAPHGIDSGTAAVSRKALAIEWVVLVALCFLVGGAPAPHVNETHYLTKAKHYWDPAYCPGDFFLDSADAHLVFYWTVGWLTRLCSLSATAWIGRFVSWGLVAWGWQRLARGAFAERAARWSTPVTMLAVIASEAAWLRMVEKYNFAGEWAVGGVEGKSLAYGLALLGLAEVVAGRWSRAWVWYGAASAFHVLVGGWFVVASAVVWLCEPRNKRTPLVKMVAGLACGGALALAGLVPALALEHGTAPKTRAAAHEIYVFERLPHHLAPLTLPAEEFRARSTRFAGVVLVFIALWYASCDARLKRVMRFGGASLGVFALGLGYECCAADPAEVLRFYWFRLADVAVPLAVAVGAGSLLVGDGLALVPARPAKRIAALAVLAWSAWLPVSMVNGRFQEPTAPADRKLYDVAAWQDACRWIARETPADAVFLIPRHAQSFKWYASRADVANWKDIPQDAAGIVAWHERCEDVFTVVNDAGERVVVGSPAERGAERVVEFCRQYGGTHVAVERFPALDLPRIYVNDAYAVYEVPAVDDSPSRSM